MSRILILFALASLVPARASAFCSKPEQHLVSAEYFQASLVVIGKITAKRYLDEQELNDVVGADLYTVDVRTIIRGKSPRKLSLVNARDSGRWTEDAEVGREYLLFLYPDPAQKRRYVVEGCGNSSDLRNAADMFGSSIRGSRPSCSSRSSP
jgi:hypothetical protein